MSRFDDFVVDNTADFTAPEDFATLEELMNWVNNISISLGVITIRKRSKFSKKNEIRKIWLQCERGGEYKNIGSSRDTETKKIGCPFELIAYRNNNANKSWTLTVICGMHTHANATNFEGHAIAMRLNDDEKNLVAELTRAHVKPRDILTIIKDRNVNNVSSIRNIYNERQKNKTSVYADNTRMEVLLTALETRGFVYEFNKNDETNELEDLFFCHPISLGIWRAFPQVLLIDATYKINRYNMPLVEMVGVTSTNTTFSIGHAVINREKIQNYVWVLNQLKMRLGPQVYPSVIVTDRELALMKACTIVFPDSNNILCRRHIWQNILKYCRPCFNLQGWNSFTHMWDVLVKSSTLDIFFNNHDRLQQFLHDNYTNKVSGHVLAYVNNNWIYPYKEKFVSAWVNKVKSYDNNTTNRVESSHAHLKSMLNSSQCKLDQIVERIEDIIKLQHISIKDKLEKSKTKMSHRLNNTRIFRFLKFKVSKHGLKKIFTELERLNSDQYITADNCGCQLRSSCGLPCAHELSFYLTENLFIPLNEIDVFWRTLDIPDCAIEEDDEVTCTAEIEMFKQCFEQQPKALKFGFLRKLKGIFQPPTDILGEPSVNKNIRGRPTSKSKKDKQVLPHQISQEKESRRHSCSSYRPNFDIDLNEPPRHSEYVYRDMPTTQPHEHPPNTTTYMPVAYELNDQPPTNIDYVYQLSTSMVNNFFCDDPFMENLVNYQPPPAQEPPTTIQYGYNYHEIPLQQEQYYSQRSTFKSKLVSEIPSFFQPYVIGIEDVEGDGNCGFRSVAVAMGRHQNEWPAIRRELLEELQEHEKQYKIIYGDDYNRLKESLHFYSSGFAPLSHWMWMPNTGLLISNKYNCIVYYLTSAGSLTFFPLWSNPRSEELNQSITIAIVHNNHFVKVDLEEEHPMPNVSTLYLHFKKNRKRESEWEIMYKDRLLAYKQAHRNIDLNVCAVNVID